MIDRHTQANIKNFGGMIKLANTYDIEDLVVIESKLKYIMSNERLINPKDKNELKKYRNKMMLVCSYMAEYQELEEIIKDISDITYENMNSVSEKRFYNELKRDHTIIYDGYFLKLAKLKYEDSPQCQYILYTRSVPS